jgi:hypothetical protein
MEDSRPFDWTDKGSIVVRRVDAIAVYTDLEGDIVIRQQRADVPYDVIITIPPQYVYGVIEGIQRQLKGSLITPVEPVAPGLQGAGGREARREKNVA